MDWVFIFFWFFLFQMMFTWLPWFIMIFGVAGSVNGKKIKVKEKEIFDIKTEFDKLKKQYNNLVIEYEQIRKEYCEGVILNGKKV